MNLSEYTLQLDNKFGEINFFGRAMGAPLTAIGLLSRMCASQSVTILTGMIENRIQNVANTLQNKQSVPDGLWEDIHWLYLALGHLVADDVETSEQRYIPSEMMKCSIESNATPTNEHSQR